MINQSFCILPFIHLHVNEYDQIKTCCYGDPIKQYTTNFDFETDAALSEIRKKMLGNIPVAQCKNCYKIEQHGGESFRQRDTSEWMSKLNLESIDQVRPALIYYDIRNDNTCNLACRICYPGASSQIEKEYRALKWPINPASRTTTLWETIDYSNIQKLLVAGGEPTIMSSFQKFLMQAIEHNRTDCELRIITNGTNLNKQILSLLSKFKSIEFTVSIDGYNQVNRYIRWPSDWPTLVQNIHRLYGITENVSFNVTVSLYNINCLSELIKFLETEYTDPLIMLNEAVNPAPHAEIAPWNLPDKTTALADLISIRSTKTYAKEQDFANRVEYFISRLTDATFSQEKLKRFFAYNDAVDQHRMIQLKDYLPELEKYRYSII